ncbi:GlsB/YeaQ/YmgE family stress response membrane protein [Candidatus Saccharibacteria bacterium]|nr:GlsB/YeaQ/YmgE family stress response membrane protein [Candidatus Saccharibacteria bacterium]
MGIIGWILLGGVAGWLASIIAGTDEQQGLLGNILVGIVGAVVGGFVLGLFGIDGVTGFNVYSLLVALLGAVIALWLWKMITGRSKA